MRSLILLIASVSMILAAGKVPASESELVPLAKMNPPKTHEELVYYAKRCAALSRVLFQVSAKRSETPNGDGNLHENLGKMAHAFTMMAFSVSYRQAEKEEQDRLLDYAAIHADITRIALLYLDVMNKTPRPEGGPRFSTDDAGRCARSYQAMNAVGSRK